MVLNEEQVIEQLSEETELTLKSSYDKKDLKERRTLLKNVLYDGSKKLKHSVPKGKHT
jgi:hypothetical protein